MIRISIILIISLIIAVTFLRHSPTENKNMMPPTELRYWRFQVSGGADGAMTVDNGVIRAECIKLGKRSDDILVYHDWIVVEPGHRYHVSFSARADRSATLHLSSGEGGYKNRWGNIGLESEILLNEKWRKCEATFTVNMEVTHPVRLPQFYFGDQTGVIWIKDIAVEEIR